MPDAHGRFRGISVPRLPWLEPTPKPPLPVRSADTFVPRDLCPGGPCSYWALCPCGGGG